MPDTLNRDVAARLEEVALLLEEQGANPYRVGAYRRAAEGVRRLEQPVSEILRTEGTPGLEQLPGIGPVLADRLHHDLGIDTLHELEAAAHDGRLEQYGGIGAKRLAGIRDALATRLGRVRPPAPLPGEEPPVEEILSVDREYRRQAAAGTLQTIAPRRFNPTHEAWLPVLHARRGDHEYTALFSNTARAHALGRTRDWVVLYIDRGRGERQYTVITAQRGVFKGKRIVRGREAECLQYYRARRASPTAADKNEEVLV